MICLQFVMDHVTIWLNFNNVRILFSFFYIFAVDFMKQSAEGYVCLFTIKNPSFPDYRSNSKISGVEWHYWIEFKHWIK